MSIRPMAELPSALERFDDVAEAIGGPPVAVFLDFDGTLSPIVEDPDAAALPKATRGVLEQLADLGTVAIVSGRGLKDLRRRAEVPGVLLVGSHGFEILGPDGRRVEQPAAAELLPEIEGAAKELREALSPLPGVQVERKRYGIAAHYRRNAAAGPEVERAVRASAGRHPGLAVSGGKKVFELRPSLDWDKGEAVRWLLEKEELRLEGAVPVYVGDDVTDEDAFRAMGERGLGIVVLGEADRPTRAAYSLAGPDEVRTFLALLAELAGSARIR
jgi:trehalose 6-phosphate phosphatase